MTRRFTLRTSGEEPGSRPFHPADPPPRIPGVGELTDRIKGLLEGEFAWVEVRGEVSGLKFHPSGHVYFNLKDDRATLSCTLWRSRKAQFDAAGIQLREGMRIVAGGRLTVYPPRGAYQLVVEAVRDSGMGDLYEAYERLKRKLHAEGLFDADRKRPLPPFPTRIGVITSRSGAAFHDITTTLQKRWPVARVVFCHAGVQGEGAASQIIRALDALEADGRCDLIIMGRGGGSIEDLWAFNDEALTRRVAAATVPVVSAVGHEVDTTISDLVADVRAATPTQAAMLATPDRDEVLERISGSALWLDETVRRRLREGGERTRQLAESYAMRAFQDRFARSRERLDVLLERLGRRSERYDLLRDSVDGLRAELSKAIARRLETAGRSLRELELQLAAANPETPLQRGYVRVMRDSTWLRSRREAEGPAPMRLVWKDGEREVRPTD